MIRTGVLLLVVSFPVAAFGADTTVEAKAEITAPHPRFGATAVTVTGTHSAKFTYLDPVDEKFTWFLAGSLREQEGWLSFSELKDDCTDSGGTKLKPNLSCSTTFAGNCGAKYKVETGASVDYPSWAGPGPGDSDSAEAEPLCSYTGGEPPVPLVNTPCTGSCTPIVINLDGAGFRFTSVEDGVFFDIDADGEDERLAWTAGGGEDAFLVLDRNGNGQVDDGTELFGSVTPQPASDRPNGFAALGVFDEPAAGGNGDGVISAADPVFSRLGLWIDTDHDAVSDPSEIFPLTSRGIQAIDLTPVVSERRDRYGNRLRWASHVLFPRGLRLAAVDVLFLMD